MQKRVKSGVFRPMTFPFILALYMVAVLLGLGIKTTLVRFRTEDPDLD